MTPPKEVIDIFTKVTKHLLTQNAKAESFNEKTQDVNCCYLTPTGLKCAIGCLIKPDCYDPAIEGSSIRIITDTQHSSSLRRQAFIKVLECSQILMSDETIHIMGELQNIHDKIPVPHWKDALHTLAHENNIPYDWSQHG